MPEKRTDHPFVAMQTGQRTGIGCVLRDGTPTCAEPSGDDSGAIRDLFKFIDGINGGLFEFSSTTDTASGRRRRE